MKNLEYRMYGLVPYNLSPIQQGIQFGHAVVEYGLIGGAEYENWARNHKTFIILNGGTTNNNPDKFGSLNKHLETLKNLGVKVATFTEPDLGDQLTAIVFLVDERVYNSEKYPDFSTLLSTFSKNAQKSYDRVLNKIANLFALRQFLLKFKLA